MCVTINNYQSIISKLENEVYPTLNRLLSTVKINEEHHLDSSAVAHLKAEIFFLEKFESNLIFPAVMSMFNESDKSNFSPNISEMVQLAHSKEEKIKQDFFLLEAFLDETYCLAGDADIAIIDIALAVFETMSNQYFPLKKQWYELLRKLNPAAVNCKNRAMGKCKCSNDLKDLVNVNHVEEDHHK
jgi:hypothetical protein